jgi:hypothetical protein
VRGIPVGDLVNDSFLRFHPAATLDYRDRGLLIPIWQAFRDVRRAEDYFRHRRPGLFHASSTAYVQHGVPARTALKMGLPVLSFGSFQEFAKPLSLDDWLDTKNADSYAADFDDLSDPEQKLAAAEAALSHRLSGGIDGATAYMERSAYATTQSEVPDVDGAVVVFLHDFYDSPHIYYDLVFPDFWTWICFTIETLDRSGRKFVIKPHPNQIPLSQHTLERLRQLYPSVRFVPDGVSNRQLVDGGMACAVTVYGTVAHEMAFLGIPTIACARHPHIGFGFCRTARNRAEYAALLAEPGPAQFDAARAREESLRFYHMHNSNLSVDEAELRDATLEVRRQCTFDDPTKPDVPQQFSALRKLPAFRAFVDECVSCLSASPGP